MHHLACVLAACGAIAVPACGGSSARPDAQTTPDATVVAPTFTARVKGVLANPDLAGAQTYHDGFAMNGEGPAAQAGDFAHHALLGTTHLGTVENEFLAIDQWRSAAGAQAVYADPQFMAGLEAMFATPPSIELFERHADWHSWGEMGAGHATGQPYWFVIVKGRLAKATLAENKAAHDAVASGFEQAAHDAGDVAHLPHLSIGDDRMFFNVDIWTSESGMLATFGNPDFQAAFGALFESPPEVLVYHSTSWYQWYHP